MASVVSGVFRPAASQAISPVTLSGSLQDALGLAVERHQVELGAEIGMHLGERDLQRFHDGFVLRGFGIVAGCEILAEGRLVGAAIAMIEQGDLLDVMQFLGNRQLIPEGGIDLGKFWRDRSERRAGQRQRIIVVGQAETVEELYRIVDHVVIDAGHTHGFDRAGRRCAQRHEGKRGGAGSKARDIAPCQRRPACGVMQVTHCRHPLW